MCPSLSRVCCATGQEVVAKVDLVLNSRAWATDADLIDVNFLCRIMTKKTDLWAPRGIVVPIMYYSFHATPLSGKVEVQRPKGMQCSSATVVQSSPVQSRPVQSSTGTWHIRAPQASYHFLAVGKTLELAPNVNGWTDKEKEEINGRGTRLRRRKEIAKILLCRLFIQSNQQ